MFPQSVLLARYRRFRAITIKLNIVLMQYLPEGALEEGARHLGFLKKGVLAFDSEDETAVLMDYCIHNVRHQDRNAVQSYLAQNPPSERSDDSLVLDAMSKSWHSVFIIEAIERGIGVRVRDLLRQTEYLLMDINLGRSAIRGGLFASRVMPFDEFIMSSGAGLPFGSGGEDADELMGELHKALFAKNIASFSQLTHQQEKDLARSIITSALSRGASSRIRYEEPGYQRARTAVDHFPHGLPVPVQAGGDIARNDPCSCGSGMKYKKCCGQ